jgi:hypothetical protein
MQETGAENGVAFDGGFEAGDANAETNAET